MAKMETEFFCSCCLCVSAPGKAIGKGKMLWGGAFLQPALAMERVGNLHQVIQPLPYPAGSQNCP